MSIREWKLSVEIVLATMLRAHTWVRPEAIQVADCWHLLKNTSTMVERFLTRHAAKLHLAHETTIQTLAGDAALKAAPELSLSSRNLNCVQDSRKKRLEGIVTLNPRQLKARVKVGDL